jgi:anti-anti-sigma factor
VELQCNKLTDTAAFVETSGRMDAAMAPNYEAQCQKWIDKGFSTIVTDLEKLEYLSSAGLRSILLVSKKLKAAGGKLVFCHVQGSVKEIFDISGFSTMFEFYKNPEEALKHI